MRMSVFIIVCEVEIGSVRKFINVMVSVVVRFIIKVVLVVIGFSF